MRRRESSGCFITSAGSTGRELGGLSALYLLRLFRLITLLFMPTSSAARARPAPLPTKGASTPASDSAAARGFLRALGSRQAAVRVSVIAPGEDKASAELPRGVGRLLAQILRKRAAGRDVVVVDADAELTTQEAADLLNVSRPYLTKLLDTGVLPSRKVGTKRRTPRAAVEAYRRAQYSTQNAALARLTRDAQAAGDYR